MSSIARRIVSGQSARFKDPLLHLDLDLTYVTDHIIIMAFPSARVQSLYRNKRSDVRRFLDKRHSHLYRIYNLCPLTENSYDAHEFQARVSRYPFPDHHPPPLSLIPLFVADVTQYLESHPDATAVIHSKAGKGRSGTMTCCYLVSLPYLPIPPTSIKNYTNMKPPQTQSTPNLLPNAAAPTNATRHTYHKLGNGAPLSVLVLPQQQTHPSAANPAASSINLELPRSAAAAAAWTNGTSVDSALPLPLLRRKPSLNPEQSIIRNNDTDPDYEIEQISHRLQTIFDLHTQRRIKPSAAAGRKSRKSGQGTKLAAGMHASAHSTGAMPSAAASTVSLCALGAGPAGRSCDAFQMSTSTNELHFNFETPTPAADETAIEHSSHQDHGQDHEDADSVAVIQNTDGHSDTKQPNMGVSIPSQRRWVGYWTRMLAGRDARLHMTSTLRQPRRQILITRITLERRASAALSKSAQRWFQRLVPHSDTLSIQLVRYQDTLVDRLESWERHARRRAKAFGNHDPSALAKDLDADQQQQKQTLKTLRRQASDLVCWDGEKFDKQHEDKIGNWGVCVTAEAERARSFKWNDDKPQLDCFAIIRESSPREAIHKGKEKLCKYTFEPREEGETRHSSASSGDSGYHSANTDTGGAGGGANHTHLAPPMPSTRATRGATTDDGAFVRKLARKASSILGTAFSSSCCDVTPPSSTAYLPQRTATAMDGSECVVGQVVDADRELCVKVLVGHTGSKHSKLRDVASAGWCWFIPSFEDPQAGAPAMATVGSKTKIRFDSHQIDFRKDPIGLVAIEVEWQWVSTGIDEDEGMDPDEPNRW